MGYASNPMPPADVLALRQRFGVTQQEMADRIGVSERTFARWERGEHPVPEIAAILMTKLEEDA